MALKASMFLSLSLVISILYSLVLKEHSERTLKEQLDEQKCNYQEEIDSLIKVVNGNNMLDTIYQSVDTFKMYYEWGKEEVYFYKYKTD